MKKEEKPLSRRILSPKYLMGLFFAVILAVVIIVVAAFSGDQEKGKDISAELLRDSEYSLTYAEVQGDVVRLAKDTETAEALSRLVDPLYQSDDVNVYYIQNVTEILGVDPAVWQDTLSGRDIYDPVTAEEFALIYDEILQYGDFPEISSRNMFIYEVLSSEAASTALFTAGDLQQERLLKNVQGISDGEEPYPADMVSIPSDKVGKIVKVYIKDGHVVRVGLPAEGSFTVKNAYITESDGETCSFLRGEKVYTMASAGVTVPRGTVCDVTFTNEGVTGTRVLKNAFWGKVMLLEEDSLYLDGHGRMGLSEDFQIYDITGQEAVAVTARNRLVGYDSVKILADDSQAVAAIIDRDTITSQDIRVLISTGAQTSYNHASFSVTCNSPFTAILVTPKEEEEEPDEKFFSGDGEATVEYIRQQREEKAIEEGKKTEYKAGDRVDYRPGQNPEGTFLLFGSADPEARFTVESITRNGISPSYRGELRLTDHVTSLTLVNTLPMEEYLYGVVSSTITASDNEETIKALALCCRAYAYNHLGMERFKEYGADLDDTSRTQSYWMYPESEAAVKAVDETYGIVPVHDGYVIEPFTFSTSAGVTCSYEEIWGDPFTGENLAEKDATRGSEDAEENPFIYLTANMENTRKDAAHLSKEADFIRFIKNSEDYQTFESDLPFYRWQVHFSTAEMTRTVNRVLPERVGMYGERILKKDGDQDAFSYDPELTSVGEVRHIRITGRSEGGVVQKMEIEGTEGTVQLTGETNIRSIFSPRDVVILRQDGSTITGWNTLPSPFYYVVKEGDGFTVYGGGFGHGMGFSQNGARILASQGMDYEAIIRHYYSYIYFGNLYAYGAVIKTLEEPEEEAE